MIAVVFSAIGLLLSLGFVIATVEACSRHGIGPRDRWWGLPLVLVMVLSLFAGPMGGWWLGSFL